MVLLEIEAFVRLTTIKTVIIKHKTMVVAEIKKLINFII